MSILMMLAAGGSSTRKTQTFTANATWIVPVSTTSLERLSGKGSDGAAGSSVPAYDSYMTHYVYRGAVLVQTIGPTYQGHYQGAKPNDYVDNTVDPGDYTNFDQFSYHFVASDDGDPATAGSSATAFGKTFPGGVGGPASVVSFDNVSLTPGVAIYPIVVPAGGSITIIYYG